MSNDELRELAAIIACDLFTNGNKDHAHRLVLELPDQKDAGGWCEQAVRDRIFGHLQNAYPPPAVPQGSGLRRWSTIPAWTLSPDSIGVWLFHPRLRSTLSPLAAYEFESITNASGTTLRCLQDMPRDAGLWYGPILTGMPPDGLWESAVPVVSARVEGTVPDAR